MTDVSIPVNRRQREMLAEFAGLTEDERRALDRWCYDEQRKRDQGIVSAEEAGRR